MPLIAFVIVLPRSEIKTNRARRNSSSGSSATDFLCVALEERVMSMIPVNSSAIRAVGYVGYVLAVQFHTSDTVYEHFGVPYSVYEGLMQADSMGAFYNQQIRGRYR
jgi:hypothetical protein